MDHHCISSRAVSPHGFDHAWNFLWRVSLHPFCAPHQSGRTKLYLNLQLPRPSYRRFFGNCFLRRKIDITSSLLTHSYFMFSLAFEREEEGRELESINRSIMRSTIRGRRTTGTILRSRKQRGCFASSLFRRQLILYVCTIIIRRSTRDNPCPNTFKKRADSFSHSSIKSTSS